MSKKTRPRRPSPAEILKSTLSDLLLQHKLAIPLPEDIPKKWEVHGDLVLLPSESFLNPVWLNLGMDLWDAVASALKVKRVARKHKINNDGYRSSSVELLKGSDGWVMHVDNKIKYTFDVTKCMFSSGNISEKLRIAKFSCAGETVVDLYAGIGYFTLPYLIHAKASLVHACEWNPSAVEALKKNLDLNNVSHKCIIHSGDNRKVCPENVADRVNLGLIPSSEDGWEVACKSLKLSGGVLHVHGNVTSSGEKEDVTIKKKTFSKVPEWNDWAKYVQSSINSILSKLYQREWTVDVLEISHVKSYAPHIDHIVVDIECKGFKGE